MKPELAVNNRFESDGLPFGYALRQAVAPAERYAAKGAYPSRYTRELLFLSSLWSGHA